MIFDHITGKLKIFLFYTIQINQSIDWLIDEFVNQKKFRKKHIFSESKDNDNDNHQQTNFAFVTIIIIVKWTYSMLYFWPFKKLNDNDDDDNNYGGGGD